MADTLVTPDGKMHVLLDDTSLEDTIQEYAGYDAAVKLRGEMAHRASDSDVYERLYWAAHDWANSIRLQLRDKKASEQQLTEFLHARYKSISKEL